MRTPVSRHGTQLQGTYFDLLEEKYPDLSRPRKVQPSLSASFAAKRKPRYWPLAVAVSLGLLGGAWLAVVAWPTRVDAIDAQANLAKPEATTTVAGVSSEGPGALERVPHRVATPEVLAESATEVPDVEIPGTADPRPMESRNVAARTSPQLEIARPDAPRASQAFLPRRQAPRSAVSLETEPRVVKRQPLRAARKIFAPAPQFPETARQAGEEGMVVLEASIDRKGTVRGVDVVQGRTPALDRAAIETLSQWRFEPATRGGEAVPSKYRVSFEFTLKTPPSSSNPSFETAAITQPLQVGGDVKPPRRLDSPIPRYPDDAWAEGITGDVLVRAVIDARGQVANVEVLKGLPYGMTEAAVEAIRRWRFAPATRHGQPVAVYRTLSVRFDT